MPVVFVNIDVKYDCDWNDSSDLRPKNLLSVASTKVESLFIPHDLPSTHVFSFDFFAGSSHRAPLFST